jgi:16S rRNA (uracil1498-N3)-methyltransferase
MTATLSKDASLTATSEICRVDAPRWPLVVAFAPVKGEKPEVIVQKLTEIGIDEIIPLTPTRFSVVKWDSARAEKLLERLQRVAREAAMQSRRVWLPKVCGVTPLASVLAQYSASLAEPGGKPVDGNDRCVVIGPEGGFAPEELEQCTKRVSLGESILRAETAAIVAGALMSRCRREIA